ncbi:hypothetical protein [Rhizorhabdus sp.]|uniref:hypothetical protein n=1 Tax=Rhizorhabdus sp. TaxID=1968843 RepID=UPI0035B45C45
MPSYIIRVYDRSQPRRVLSSIPFDAATDLQAERALSDHWNEKRLGAAPGRWRSKLYRHGDNRPMITIE